MSVGYIYILTNPSFPEYVKIGYADNVESRVRALNSSDALPLAFRVYATYEVDSRLSDIKLHTIIDRLNPDLRSIDNFNGKKRVREFYAMPAEDAYTILEAIAEINNRTDKLVKRSLTKDEIQAEKIAEEVKREKRMRSANFSFTEIDIPVGAVLINIDNPEIKCIVVDDRRIEYNGETMSITAFAKLISGKSYLSKGPRFLSYNFTYNGQMIRELYK